MTTPKGHLRLVPKPIAKCGVPRMYPIGIDGVDLRRVGRMWALRHTQRGRVFETTLTTDELRDLVEQGSKHLEMEAGDE